MPPGTQHGRRFRLRGPRRAVAAHGPARRPRRGDRGRGADQAVGRGGGTAPAVRGAARRGGRTGEGPRASSPASAPRSSRPGAPRATTSPGSPARDAAAHVFVDQLDDAVRRRRATTAIISSGCGGCGSGRRVTAADGAGALAALQVVDASRRAASIWRRASRPPHEPELRPRVVVAVALTKGGARRRGRGAHRARRAPHRTGAQRAVGRALGRAARGGGVGPLARRRAGGGDAVAAGACPEVARGRRPRRRCAGRPGLVVADRGGAPPGALAVTGAGGEWTVARRPRGRIRPDEERLARRAPRAVRRSPIVLRAQPRASRRGRAPCCSARHLCLMS